MNTPKNPKRGGAFISTTKVLIITASLAATVAGWAAMSAPAVAATTSAQTTSSSQASTNSLASALGQFLSPATSSSAYQPAIRTRSSR